MILSAKAASIVIGSMVGFAFMQMPIADEVTPALIKFVGGTSISSLIVYLLMREKLAVQDGKFALQDSKFTIQDTKFDGWEVRAGLLATTLEKIDAKLDGVSNEVAYLAGRREERQKGSVRTRSNDSNGE